MKSFHKSEDVSLSLKIDRDFRGIIRGFAHDESEGCTLAGELTMTVHRHTKIRSLETTFVGEVCVNFKTTNSMGVPTADGVETHAICRKRITHFNEDTVNSNSNSLIKSIFIEPGTYKFSFEFSISATLPHSFNGKHGSIQYDLGATAMRTIFSSDVHVSRPIILRRCLMDDLDPVAPAAQVVTGNMHPDIVKYSATAPSMVYCEGGLLNLGLNVELKDPDKFSVRMVTCGLQEQVFYITTGRRSLTNQAMHYNECIFPLGCSTFFPSKHEEYNPHELHNYNAIFRLYPRVHTDNKSSLIVVQHTLLIRMIIDDNEIAAKSQKRKGSADSTTSNAYTRSTSRSILSHLTLKQQDHNISRSLPDFGPISIHSNGNTHRNPTLTPPLSRSPSPDELSISSASAESVSSNLSLAMAMEQLHPFQSNIVKVTSRKLNENEGEGTSSSTGTGATNENNTSPSESQQSHRNSLHHHIGHSLTVHHHFNPLHFHRDAASDGTYECRLSVPIIVTSREEYSEGCVPALPDYETAADQPPSYRASIQTLPPVPMYPPTDDDMTRKNHNVISN